MSETKKSAFTCVVTCETSRDSAPTIANIEHALSIIPWVKFYSNYSVGGASFVIHIDLDMSRKNAVEVIND